MASLNGHEFEQSPGDGEGKGNLAYCSPGVTKSWTCLSISITTAIYIVNYIPIKLEGKTKKKRECLIGVGNICTNTCIMSI